jgi:hypothetical protein
MAHEGRRCHVSLCDEEIISNLISDNLSDVPYDIFSESESDSDTAGGSDRGRVNVLSENESGSIRDLNKFGGVCISIIMNCNHNQQAGFSKFSPY